jgi:hypothetical protein
VPRGDFGISDDHPAIQTPFNHGANLNHWPSLIGTVRIERCVAIDNPDIKPARPDTTTGPLPAQID